MKKTPNFFTSIISERKSKKKKKKIWAIIQNLLEQKEKLYLQKER